MVATWVQKIKPNTNDKTLYVYDANGKVMKDWNGWCLAVTQQAFGIKKRLYASAIDAWNKNTTKHTGGGMTIPIGMYVPVFYKGGQYGHIVIAYRDAYDHIKVWSSPYTHKAYFDTFQGPVVSTLDGVGKKYGGSYVGWSETLTETRIIQWENVPASTTPKPETPALPKIDWIDLPEALGLFTKVGTSSIDLDTNKAVQNYTANTKINFVQETTYNGVKYYRTESAKQDSKNWAFKASDFVEPKTEPEPPAPTDNQSNSNTDEIPSTHPSDSGDSQPEQNKNDGNTKDDTQQGGSGQSSDTNAVVAVLNAIVAFIKKIINLIIGKDK